MAWVSFLFGRPGSEVEFEVPPEAMTISPGPIKSLQRNIAGDFKKSVLKQDCPQIKINSSYLTLTQKNQFASLMAVPDTFLSFICRDDWQMINDLASIIDVNHLQLSNNSALKLSQTYVYNGLASIITISNPFTIAVNPAYGLGPWGAGPYGIGAGGYTFDPGAITYNDTILRRNVMYTIDVNSTNKIIRVVLSGHMTIDEISSYTREFRDIIFRSEINEYSLLASAERLDPLPQDSLPLIIESFKFALMRVNKIATVHKRVVTRMQFQKAERIAITNCGCTQRMMQFTSIKDALAYLTYYRN